MVVTGGLPGCHGSHQDIRCWKGISTQVLHAIDNKKWLRAKTSGTDQSLCRKAPLVDGASLVMVELGRAVEP